MDCREKDSAIRELKGKIVNLIRQLEMQKAALLQQEKMHVSARFSLIVCFNLTVPLP